ncbi:glycoside hydrolase family 43 protein [Sphingomonas sp. CFBP 8760]|uniref:glycoside hydrolase family 43 protein n=1 Tax=Sphingomonas sp. CFBP 8760 TaxID=2775282 RepID=UPI001783530D|nr:glycoside hydrolase family 43 protein [Sphingomonas sp. CFBP 8760]MBD8546105.1 family 43 glycosylhydrolase [Sphingomonas sp. CFBP 8760]
MRYQTLLGVIAVILATGAPAVSAPQAAAPLPAAPLLMPQMPLHDPWIVADRATGTYHLFTRNDARMTGSRQLGIMAYTSRDLKHWTQPKVVFGWPKDGWATDGAWAPEVHPWRGKWYLFATFHNEKLPLPAKGARPLHRRSTVLAVAGRPGGPFALVRGGELVAPAGQMTLDGSLYVDPAGKPWMVYAHEWVQTDIGTIEAVPLRDDLSAAGPPRVLFRANEAPWAMAQPQADGTNIYVTDGPELFRTRTGTLLMLWSRYGKGGYIQGIARSKTGDLAGPWEHLPPLVGRDSGHGMVFRAFDGRLMMVLHRPFTRALGKLYELRDEGDTVSLVREATELDLEAYPTHPCEPGKRPAADDPGDC